MPEFEEPEAAPSSKENYTPSTDATKKPRTRRRSGGFKTEYTAPSVGIGEVDPADALKREKLSGGSKPAPKAKKERAAPKADKPERKREKPSPRVSNADPSPETLAAIQRVEARLDERKKERDARRAGKDKPRSAKGEKKPSGERRSAGKKPQSQGILGSILTFFGLGPKPPASKPSNRDKPSGGRSQGGRPRGKGGNGNNRGPGQNRRSGPKGRRSGGNGPRRNDRRSQEKQS